MGASIRFGWSWQAAVIGLGCLSSSCFAASAPQTLRDIYRCQVQQHEFLTEYHIYASDPGDPTHRSDLQKALSEASACVNLVDSGLRGLSMPKQAAEVKLRYAAFETVANQNIAAVAKKGAPEYEVLNVMVQNELDLQASLEKSLKDVQVEQKVHIKPPVDQARHLAVLMQYMAARYIERATSAGGSAGRDDSKEATIDDLAKEFQKGLDGLKGNAASSPEVKKDLAAIVTKWKFIQGSLLNYNEKTVPFTVNRHSKAIVGMLEDVADKMDK